jgi:hypothetical protein
MVEKTAEILIKQIFNQHKNVNNFVPPSCQGFEDENE